MLQLKVFQLSSYVPLRQSKIHTWPRPAIYVDMAAILAPPTPEHLHKECHSVHIQIPDSQTSINISNFLPRGDGYTAPEDNENSAIGETKQINPPTS